MDDIQTNVKKIMSRVLKLPVEEITEDSSSETIPNWDSLAHLNLVLAFEEEFKVSFSTDEILRMMSFQNIVDLISSKLDVRWSG